MRIDSPLDLRREVDLLRAEVRSLSREVASLRATSARLPQLARLCAKTLGVTLEAMQGEHRDPGLVYARWVFIYAAREMVRPPPSFPRLGELLFRNHTTMIHGYRQVKRDLARGADSIFRGPISDVRRALDLFDAVQEQAP